VTQFTHPTTIIIVTTPIVHYLIPYTLPYYPYPDNSARFWWVGTLPQYTTSSSHTKEPLT